MRAGELKHPVTIQNATVTPDEYGAGAKTWGAFKETRAAIWPAKTDEVVIDGKLTAVSRHTIRIRYVAGVTAGMRVLFGTRTFEILGTRILNEQKRYIDLTCKEYV
jgi:SPP1 family predicted phage head-tail adaptor